MLNRTNLTLSTLSNRLNLGTRSLVLNTGVNNGTALRIRHAHHDVMRKFKAVFKVGLPIAYPMPSITDPATSEAPRAAWRPSWPADASSRPSSRSRASAACAASATSPRQGRGRCQATDEVGAAGAASRRTANVAIATVAGS
jgi:hypothetical protein